jgi:hypothetical protein
MVPDPFFFREQVSHMENPRFSLPRCCYGNQIDPR